MCVCICMRVCIVLVCMYICIHWYTATCVTMVHTCVYRCVVCMLHVCSGIGFGTVYNIYYIPDTVLNQFVGPAENEKTRYSSSSFPGLNSAVLLVSMFLCIGRAGERGYGVLLILACLQLLHQWLGVRASYEYSEVLHGLKFQLDSKFCVPWINI